MAWPTSTGVGRTAPNVNSGQVAGSSITTAFTAVPNFSSADCWPIGAMVRNDGGVEVTLTLANDAETEQWSFVIPPNYAGTPPGLEHGIPFMPITGLKWKVSATANFFAKVWGYQ